MLNQCIYWICELGWIHFFHIETSHRLLPYKMLPKRLKSNEEEKQRVRPHHKLHTNHHVTMNVSERSPPLSRFFLFEALQLLLTLSRLISVLSTSVKTLHIINSCIFGEKKNIHIHRQNYTRVAHRYCKPTGTVGNPPVKICCSCWSTVTFSSTFISTFFFLWICQS